MRNSNLVCPISNTKINNHVSRLTAGMVMSLLILFAITQHPAFLIAVLLEFFMKVFIKRNCSPLYMGSCKIIEMSKLPEKLIDEAPKTFSARMGLLVSAISFILLLNGMVVSSVIAASVLMTLAALHAIFNYCVGCVIYHYLVLPHTK